MQSKLSKCGIGFRCRSNAPNMHQCHISHIFFTLIFLAFPVTSMGIFVSIVSTLNDLTIQLLQSWILSSRAPFLAGLVVLSLPFIGALLFSWMRQLSRHPRGFLAGLFEVFFQRIKKLSVVKKALESKGRDFLVDTVISFASKETPVTNLILPEEGVEHDELKKLLVDLSDPHLGEDNWAKGKSSGSVYMPLATSVHSNQDIQNFAYSRFSLGNPLHMDQFPAIQKFEREILSMCLDLFNATPAATGILTSGGTESILMALLGYRNYARKYYPHIKVPEIIAPASIHPAFGKACYYFGMRLVHARLHPRSLTCDVEHMKSLITPRTICLVGSAVCYPFGSIDPIDEISELARSRNLFCHVDACLGGFFLCFLKKRSRAGEEVVVPPYDFEDCPGVTSISADTHKFGMAQKGTSVVMFRSIEVRNLSFYSDPHFQGGLYITPTMHGSRSGGLIAVCWAALMSRGLNGYLHLNEMIHGTAKGIAEGVEEMDGVELGCPWASSPVVFIRAENEDESSSYQIADVMSKEFGWKVDSTVRPAGFHFCVTAPSIDIEESFLSDLCKAIRIVRENPKVHAKDGVGAIYGTSELVPTEAMEGLLGMVMAYFNDGKIVSESEDGMKVERPTRVDTGDGGVETSWVVVYDESLEQSKKDD